MKISSKSCFALTIWMVWLLILSPRETNTKFFKGSYHLLNVTRLTLENSLVLVGLWFGASVTSTAIKYTGELLGFSHHQKIKIQSFM